MVTQKSMDFFGAFISIYKYFIFTEYFKLIVYLFWYISIEITINLFNYLKI